MTSVTSRVMIVLAVLGGTAAAGEPKEDCVAKKGRWLNEGGFEGCRAANQREGLWVKRYPSGAVQESVTWTAGKPGGPYLRYHPNCQIAARGQYLAGEKDGEWKSWSEAGKKVAEGPFKKNLRDGKWTFYDKDGQKQLEGPFAADVAEGKFTEWFANGNKWRDFEMKGGDRQGAGPEACRAKGGEWSVNYDTREEGCRVDEEAQGTWTGYYGTGQVRWRAETKDGHFEGPYEDFHIGGATLRKGTYANGIPEGTHEFRNTDGTLFGSATVTKGSGQWKLWNPDGKLGIEGEYKDGKQQGKWKTYYDGGALEAETTYTAGVLDGGYRAYYKTGEVGLLGFHQDGRRVGNWVAKFQNGNVEWSGAYDGEGTGRIGWWVNMRWGGQIEAMGTMRDDKRNGTWLLFLEDGKLAAIGTFKDDVKEGEWTMFWPTGSVWRKAVYKNGVEAVPAAEQCDRVGGVWTPDTEKRALGCQVCRAKEDDSIDRLSVGEWTWWHPNGALEKQGALVDGKPDGAWKFFFDNDQKMLLGEFRAGKEQGPWEGFYRGGEKRFKGAYDGGLPSGDWTSWQPDGKVLSAGKYEAGKKVGKWEYIEDGKKEEVAY